MRLRSDGRGREQAGTGGKGGFDWRPVGLVYSDIRVLGRLGVEDAVFKERDDLVSCEMNGTRHGCG